MPKSFGPRERVSTPEDREPSASPEWYQPQRPLDQFLATTLSEIQQDQGRLMERVGNIEKKVEGVGDKLDTLNSHYTFVKGFGAALVVIIPFAAWLLWLAISDRFDRMLKLIDERPAQSQQAPVTPSAAPPKRSGQ